MLEKLISYSVKFITVVGSLVTGFTALFYATGFLARNSQLIYLGMPEGEIVNVDYLITGARFFAFLPMRLILGFSFWKWPWTLWILCGVLLFIALLAGFSTQEYGQRFNNRWIFLGTGIILWVILLIPLWGEEREFFKYLPSPSASDALFKDDLPFSEKLALRPDLTQAENVREALKTNSSQLIVFTVLALTGTGLMLFWQKKIEESVSSSSSVIVYPTRLEKTVSSSNRLHLVRLLLDTVGNIVPLLIAIVALFYILLLPMNYIYPVMAKQYPEVRLRFSSEEIYSELLFSVDKAYQSDLDSNKISGNLWREFENNKIFFLFHMGGVDNKSLLEIDEEKTVPNDIQAWFDGSESNRVTISTEEESSRWLIIDKDTNRTYSIKKGEFTFDGRRKYPILSNATISPEEKGSKWLIIDKDTNRTYSIRKGEFTFDIFSHNATVSIKTKGSWWLITDKDNRQTYTVRKEKDGLDIHRIEIEPDKPLLLLKEEKGDKVLLYSRDRKKIWQIQKGHITELIILNHRSIW